MRNPTVVGLVGFGLLCACLEALVAGGAIEPLVVPRPSDVFVAIFRLIIEEGLPMATLATLLESGIATAIAITLGVPAGYLLARYKTFGAAYENWLGAMFAAPLVLLYPLFLVIFGRSYVTVVFMGLITGIIPIIINTRLGLTSVSATLINVGRAFNATPAQQFWMILLPAAVPTIFTGIRLGLIYALVNIIGIEFLVNFGGLGRLVSEMFDRFDVPGMYAAILFIILVSMGFLWLLARVETRLRAA